MKNRICLVTGASRGIGKAIVKKLLENGAYVCASSRSIDGLNILKDELVQYSDRLHLFAADLRSGKHVEDLCKSITNEVGDIDILVNNAGILHLQSLSNSTDEILHDSFQVNVFAPFALTRYFSKAMIENKRGVIVNLCSSSSYTGGGAPEHCVYAATKHALLGFQGL